MQYHVVVNTARSAMVMVFSAEASSGLGLIRKYLQRSSSGYLVQPGRKKTLYPIFELALPIMDMRDRIPPIPVIWDRTTSTYLKGPFLPAVKYCQKNIFWNAETEHRVDQSRLVYPISKAFCVNLSTFLSFSGNASALISFSLSSKNHKSFSSR